ncbi:MAG: YfhO family protein, partial [Clostridiales bacterium]|nr:YfhO family protein [Clostridiales bacterium]
MADRNRYALIRRLSVVFLITMLFSYVSYYLVMKTNGSTTVPPALTMRNSAFDEGWFDGIRNAAEDIRGIRDSLKEGDTLVHPEAWRTLISDHFDIFTLLILPFDTEVSVRILKASMFIRFGLAAASMALFLEKTSKNSRLSVLLLSVVYGLSGIGAVSALDIRLLNFMIVIPAVCLFVRKLAVSEDRKFIFLTAFSFGILFSTGISGLVTGLPLAVAFSLFVSFSFSKTAYETLVNVMKTLLSAAMGGLMALLPLVCQIGCAGKTVDVKAAFKDTDVRGVLFDFLTDLTDGKPFDASSAINTPSFGTGMIVLFLLVLFFVNTKIPFGLRAFSGVAFLVYYLSGAVSSADRILSVFENSGSFLWSRYICLLFLMLVAADMSLEKIRSVEKEAVILSMFLVLGIIILSNSSASDVSPSIFSLYFSAAAVIFWCAVVLRAREGNGKLPARAVYIGLAGIIFNYFFCLGPSDFSGSGILFEGSFASGEDSAFNIVLPENETFPLFGTSERDLYLVAEGNLSEDLEGKSLPELMNLIDENAFYKIPARTINLDNAEEPVPGLYTTLGDTGDITIRANGL